MSRTKHSKARSRAGTPAPGIVRMSPVDDDSTEEFPLISHQPSKKSRHCGNCRKVGHNSRSCPDREKL